MYRGKAWVMPESKYSINGRSRGTTPLLLYNVYSNYNLLHVPYGLMYFLPLTYISPPAIQTSRHTCPFSPTTSCDYLAL